MPAVTVAFKYEQQEWTHTFDLDVNASILDLKRQMTSSAPEHAAWFDLCKGGSAVKGSEAVDPSVTYDFEYVGPRDEAGQVESAPNEDVEDPFPPEGPAREMAAPAQPSASAASALAVARWKITGGADKGGIIARQSESLKSPELGRVSTGAIVEEIARVGERLCYRLEEGSGPSKGWVSIKVSGKELLQKL